MTPAALAASPSESGSPVAAAGEAPDPSQAAELLGPVLAFSNQTAFAGEKLKSAVSAQWSIGRPAVRLAHNDRWRTGSGKNPVSAGGCEVRW